MIHGDFLKLRTKDWRDADIVFANSTCYDENIMAKLSKIAGEFDRHCRSSSCIVLPSCNGRIVNVHEDKYSIYQIRLLQVIFSIVLTGCCCGGRRTEEGRLRDHADQAPALQRLRRAGVRDVQDELGRGHHLRAAEDH